MPNAGFVGLLIIRDALINESLQRRCKSGELRVARSRQANRKRQGTEAETTNYVDAFNTRGCCHLYHLHNPTNPQRGPYHRPSSSPLSSYPLTPWVANSRSARTARPAQKFARKPSRRSSTSPATLSWPRIGTNRRRYAKTINAWALR